MPQILLFIFLVVLTSNGRSQSSTLDSLKFIHPIPHSGSISAIEISPNKKQILTASADKTVKIWDLKSGKLISTYESPYGIINAKYISDDMILTAEYFTYSNHSGSLHLFDINTKESKRIFTEQYPKNMMYDEEREIISASIEGVVKFWSVKNLEELSELSLTHTEKYTCSNEGLSTAQISKDFSKAITMMNCVDTLIVWNLATNSIAHKLFIEIENDKDEFDLTSFDDYSIAKFSPDYSSIVIVYRSDSIIRLWDSNTGKLKYELTEHSSSINSCFFDISGDKLITASKDNTIRIWNLKTGNCIKKIEINGPEYGTYLKSQFIDNDQKIITYSGPYLRIFDSDGVELVNFKVNGMITKAIYYDKMDILIVGTFTGDINIFDLGKNKKILDLSYEKEPYKWLSFDETGQNALGVINNQLFSNFSLQNGIINKTEHTLGDNFSLENVCYSPNKKFLAINYLKEGYPYFSLYDVAEKKQINKEYGLYNIKFSPDSKNLFYYEPWGKYNIKYDLLTKQKSLNKNFKYSSSDGFIFNKNSDKIALTEKKIYIMDVNKNEITDSLYHPSLEGKSFRNIDFDDNRLITVTWDYFLIWNIKKHKIIKKIKKPEQDLDFIFFHVVKNKIISNNQSGEIITWDLNNKAKCDTIKAHLKRVIKIRLIEEENKLITASEDNSIKIWDLNSNEIIHTLNAHKTAIRWIDLSPDNKILMSVSKDNQTILWDINSGEEIYSRFLFENNNWLVKLPNFPYYMCSKDASKMLHYVTPSLKVIGFDQLDPVNNRPDIVLESIGKYFGGADQELVASYKDAWEKRINRLGLDKEKLGKGEIAVPNAEIINADTKTDKAPMIEYNNSSGKTIIHVKATDSKYKLKRYNVYVNEVPVYGSLGRSITHLNTSSWEGLDTITLSQGKNKIQVSVMNELGLENFKYPTYVNYTSEKEIVAKTHYIGIGVNAFQDSSHNLKYCVKDVRDLAKAFSKENAKCDTLLFTDQQVTKENILSLKEYLNKTSVNDKVIISCSSHGLLDDSLNFYLAMHDVDFINPKARGLKYEALESLLDGIPARQKLLLLDACNSGENDKTEILKQELQQKEKNMDSSQVLAARGVIIKLEEENKSNFKKMNELFVNVRNNTGSVIISAAGGQESALEAISVDGKTIENGAFTYSILECLKQNKGKELKVNTLKQYAEKRVEEITNGKQKPTSRQETMEVDWGVR